MEKNVFTMKGPSLIAKNCKDCGSMSWIGLTPLPNFIKVLDVYLGGWIHHVNRALHQNICL